MKKIFLKYPRCAMLVSMILLMATTAIAIGGDIAPPIKKYPPYPDVWGYSNAQGISALCTAADGDFYIFPGEYYKDVPKTKIIGLFSGSTVELSPKEAEAVARMGKPVAGLSHLKCAEHYGYLKSLTLSNGYTIERSCIGGSCLFPFDLGAEVRDKDRHVVARKTFLYMLAQPRKTSLPGPAADRVEGEIVERVRQLDPFFVALEDNTFLFFHGAIVRFDAHLNTKFPINQDHLFIIDTTLIEEIYHKAAEKEERWGLAWNQLVQDAVAELLNKIKQEKHP